MPPWAVKHSLAWGSNASKERCEPQIPAGRGVNLKSRRRKMSTSNLQPAAWARSVRGLQEVNVLACIPPEIQRPFPALEQLVPADRPPPTFCAANEPDRPPAKFCTEGWEGLNPDAHIGVSWSSQNIGGDPPRYPLPCNRNRSFSRRSACTR